jgi:hypothetical protein
MKLSTERIWRNVAIFGISVYDMQRLLATFLTHFVRDTRLPATRHGAFGERSTEHHSS